MFYKLLCDYLNSYLHSAFNIKSYLMKKHFSFMFELRRIECVFIFHR